jgi:hypothetical protein
MAKSKYLNFNEYAQNDPEYLLRVLKDELFKSKSKIEFKDGSTYHVTKSGSRYWHKGNYIHREDGPSCMYQANNKISEYYYLFSTNFETYEEHQIAVNRLIFLREQTNGEIEPLVEEIAKNIQWDDRQKLWKSILRGSTNSVDMIDSLTTLSEQYKKLTAMSKKFITDFS